MLKFTKYKGQIIFPQNIDDNVYTLCSVTYKQTVNNFKYDERIKSHLTRRKQY